ncbi:hypothetical protein SAMN04489713_13512 [Actinomadura madurae]|uniref:Uncharacterized protein n=1 Tax=Actinomadura madurae TaxID=1993 RepID=A0A1I5YN97_9ACTN|nr:hypothetical protein SAMN04489713_13512 [Actinomadura madurae]
MTRIAVPTTIRTGSSPTAATIRRTNGSNSPHSNITRKYIRAKTSITAVGAVSAIPEIIMSPRSAPSPPISPNTVGTRMSAATADSLFVMTNAVKRPIVPNPRRASMVFPLCCDPRQGTRQAE